MLVFFSVRSSETSVPCRMFWRSSREVRKPPTYIKDMVGEILELPVEAVKPRDRLANPGSRADASCIADETV
jgi:hypothetical protein